MWKTILILLLLAGAAAGAWFYGKPYVDDLLQTEADTLVVEEVPDTVSLPCQPLSSAASIEYVVTLHDSLHSGRLDSYQNLYDNAPGQFTFRGGPLRDAAFGGTVTGTPSRITEVWSYTTGYDASRTTVGTWGGGTGWTGQPLFVEWPDSLMQRFRAQSPGLTSDFGPREIIVSSLCGYTYFLNFDNGRESRQPIAVGNPVKGTSSLDPYLNGNLYVGQGIPKTYPVHHIGIDLFAHQIMFQQGADYNIGTGWVAYDSSPIVAGGFLFWPGENGVLYKYRIGENGEVTPHSTLYCKFKDYCNPGIENSLCVYRNYGFFGNNSGRIVCIDLNTLTPIWLYDNHDDTDGTIVCEVEDSIPYLYTGCEVDQRGLQDTSYFVKLNGLNGSLVWEQRIPCTKLILQNTKHYDGGLYCTPLLGGGDCSHLIFATFCQPNGEKRSHFMAFDKKTGEVVYRTPLQFFSWSSPVAFYNEQGKLFIFTGDSGGVIYLIEGSTGRILYEERRDGALESSAVVVGNQLVIGARGSHIYKFQVE